jgi:hypothetical protein
MREPEVVRIDSGVTRFRKGLFIVSIMSHPERVVFSVFTSRATSFVELAERLTLRDNLGTDYVMQRFDNIDGRGSFEFLPGIPAAAASWNFGEAGGPWIVWARRSNELDRGVTRT